MQAIGEQVLAQRGIAHRTKDHGLKRGGDLMHEHDYEGRLADAAHAQHAHHPTALLQHPLLELHALGFSPIQHVHREGIAPIQARPGEGRCLFGPRRGFPLFEDQQGRGSRASRCGGELGLHPEGIEVRLWLPSGQP